MIWCLWTALCISPFVISFSTNLLQCNTITRLVLSIWLLSILIGLLTLQFRMDLPAQISQLKLFVDPFCLARLTGLTFQLSDYTLPLSVWKLTSSWWPWKDMVWRVGVKAKFPRLPLGIDYTHHAYLAHDEPGYDDAGESWNESTSQKSRGLARWVSLMLHRTLALAHTPSRVPASALVKFRKPKWGWFTWLEVMWTPFIKYI